MDIVKKHKTNQTSPFIETNSLRNLARVTGNTYEAINIISKRSKQIASELKEELHSKLEEFGSSSDNLEEVFENREQIEISKVYEKLPHPTLLATSQLLEDEIHYRYKDEE